MNFVEHKTFDEERALYASRDTVVSDCRFDGPADGESALKESENIRAENCYFNLRYPFWHTRTLSVKSCEMTPLCRAALWYCEDVTVENTKLNGIKALRECRDVRIDGCEIRSLEFGWFTQNVRMCKTDVAGEYFMLRAKNLRFEDVTLNGKYSFQYITDSVFENCHFDTKDAFWHAKNVTVKNSVIKGEYLAWYCENVTFENCVIIGTQPLCYCKGLRLIDCEMRDADLAFEKSEVEATLTSPIVSIKNPTVGSIRVPACGEVIRDDAASKCEIVILGDAAL